MASAKDQIVCHVCGFKNAPDATRCVSCGAKIDTVSVDYTAEEEAARANQQEGFSVVWVGAAFGVYVLLQAIVLVLLPLVISSFDPFGGSSGGVAALAISCVVWFFGGIVVGFISPGKTFLEPAVGAFLSCIPTILYVVWQSPEGLSPSMLESGVLGIMGIMISLFGAFLGERVQARTRGHAPRRR
jgi:hypothetical protein